MGILSRLFKRGGDDDEGEPDAPITLDLPARRAQLERLERCCDALTTEMKSDPAMFDRPGWSERINEYNRVAGTSMSLRQGTPTREALIDLAFEVRPVFPRNRVPTELAGIADLQQEVLAAAQDLQEVLPGERPVS